MDEETENPEVQTSFGVEPHIPKQLQYPSPEEVERHNLTLPVLLDTGDIAYRYGITEIPQYVLIGKDGKLASSGLQINPPTESEIVDLLKWRQ